jgi:type II secretory pathway pseudopilin PulG
MHILRNWSLGADKRARKLAFTVVELLMAIAVICLFALLGMAESSAPKEPSKTELCASNIRQLLVATQKYASDHNDRLPEIGKPTSWAWDLPEPVASALLATGAEKKHFYCPGTSPRFTDKENWAAPGRGNGTSLWGFGVTADLPKPTDFHLIGYVLVYSGPGCRVFLDSQNSIIRSEAPFGGGRVIPAAERVLVADATISTGLAQPGYEHPENNYTNIIGGYRISHLSAHLAGDLPAGGNVGFKDGHVAWRDFKEMVPRTGGSTPFWW